MGEEVTLTLSGLESALLKELNIARTNPQGYADLLEKQRRPYYEGVDLKYPEVSDTVLRTKEGIYACEDAIRFLLGAKGQPELKLSYGMTMAAKKALKEHGGHGVHEPSSISHFEHYGKYEDEVTEIAGFGGHTARGMMMAFLICDGDTERKQRNIIYDPKWKWVGVAAGEHSDPNYKIMGVLNFASTWYDN